MKLLPLRPRRSASSPPRSASPPQKICFTPVVPLRPRRNSALPLSFCLAPNGGTAHSRHENRLQNNNKGCAAKFKVAHAPANILDHLSAKWRCTNPSHSKVYPCLTAHDFRVDCELCRHWGLSRRTGAKQNCAGGVEEQRGRSRFFAGAKQNGAGAKQNGRGEEEGITCTNPRNSGQLLKDINPEDLTCEDPMIVRFEKVYNNLVEEGETIHLVCESSGIPKPDVTVILPSGLNVTVETGGRVTVTDNGTVTITDVTAAVDSGLYICIATSPVGSTFQTLSVDIQPNMPSTVTMTPQNITDKPESNSSHGSGPSFTLPVLLGSVLGTVAGTVVLGGVIFMIWCKRRAKNPPPGPDTSVVFNNINTTATVSSGHGQTGQGRSQNVTNPSYAQRSAVPQLPLDVYEDVELPPSEPRPKGAGPKQPAKKKALKPSNRNKAPDDERPPPPPPRAGAAAGAAAVYANESAAALDHLPYYQPLTKT
ncbi:hypothetical protein Bbelb_320450 [Branchiostoma belcheri]|nr:hypothetical protein Bbelb_320450 [Branchiostoma belcheri]